jgi:hypothetical protein
MVIHILLYNRVIPEVNQSNIVLWIIEYIALMGLYIEH